MMTMKVSDDHESKTFVELIITNERLRIIIKNFENSVFRKLNYFFLLLQDLSYCCNI